MSDEIMTTNATDDYFCTLSIDNKRDKLIVLKALNAATSLTDVEGTFTIIGIMTTSGKRPNTNADCINTYLILEDGSAYFSQSDGIAKSAKWIHKIFTDEQIAEGIEVFVKPISLSGGRTLKTLDFVL